jgi:hypothetical protein
VTANLYALRLTDSNLLARSTAPIGPDNDEWLDRQLTSPYALVVAAWGGPTQPRGDGRRTAAIAARLRDLNARCLGFNADRTPRHPAARMALPTTDLPLF